MAPTDQNELIHAELWYNQTKNKAQQNHRSILWYILISVGVRWYLLVFGQLFYSAPRYMWGVKTMMVLWYKASDGTLPDEQVFLGLKSI